MDVSYYIMNNLKGKQRYNVILFYFKMKPF